MSPTAAQAIYAQESGPEALTNMTWSPVVWAPSRLSALSPWEEKGEEVEGA